MSEQIKESVNLWDSSLFQFVSHCRISYRSIHSNPRYVSAVVALADKLEEAEQSRDINHAAAKMALDQRDTVIALLNEAVGMIEGYKRAGWMTNPAAAEQATDFIERVRSPITTNGKQPLNNVRVCEHAWEPLRRVLVCGVDCHPGDTNCNNYCNRAPQKGPMAAYPPKGPDA